MILLSCLARHYAIYQYLKSHLKSRSFPNSHSTPTRTGALITQYTWLSREQRDRRRPGLGIRNAADKNEVGEETETESEFDSPKESPKILGCNVDVIYERDITR